ncbi:MAG: maleylpyruvate isomerase family mycothiol-dependent enzyme [Actinobacteria bacterium]|nr:maleylpyruvate isomerase family mycothiol-dependent enzyme [Actinomycetota bacterium]
MATSDRDLGAPVPGLEWSAAQVLAHLAIQAERFRDFVSGERDPHEDLVGIDAATVPARVAAVNERLLGTVTDRDPGSLIDRLRGGVTGFLEATAGVEPTTRFRSWEGTSDVAGATATLVAELLVHGLDVGRALDVPWRVDPARAHLALPAVWALLPNYVDAVATRRVDEMVAITPRGGDAVRVRILEGSAVVAPGVRGATCRIHGRADDLLLLAFGRVSVGSLLRRGRLVATGRRPWVGLRVSTWFLAP